MTNKQQKRTLAKIATPYTNKGIELKEKSWPARKN